MPQQYAREIIACGGDFRAKIWGDDDGEAGILVSFVAPNISNDQLDEDDGTDELYVKTSFRDCHTGLTRTFKRSNYVANFGWG